MPITEVPIYIKGGEAGNFELEKRYYKDGNWERMKRLLAKAIEENTSPSHDYHHLALVLKYADLLFQWSLEQGDSPNWEHFFAAACLHDLGRSDPTLHQQGSLDKSIEMARPILEQVGYQMEEMAVICQIISEHDQPERSETSLEAKILKEADFLAGMGAWGILRTLVWGGECRRPVVKMIDSFESGMRKRIESLQLPPSRKIAWQEWPLTRVFLAHLKRQYELTPVDREIESFQGEYFVFEGISGSGKDTQAARLAEYFRSCGRLVEVVSEPSGLLRQTLSLWKKELGEVTQAQRAHLMTADRMGLVEQKILPALRQKKTVIGIRSWISTMVYQGESEQEIAEILLMNDLVPRPKAIFYLTLPPEEALARVEGRLQAKIGTRGDFEKLERMKQMAQRYEEAVRLVCPGTKIERINASGTPEQVFQEIVASQGVVRYPIFKTRI